MDNNNPLLNKAVALLHLGEEPEFTSFVDKVRDYCISRENGKVFDEWNQETIRQLVAYHYLKGTLIVLADESMEIQGVFMWYNCDNDYTWNFVKNWEPDNPEGDSVFLAFLFADSTQVWKQIVFKLIEREPDVIHKKLIGCRERSGKPTRVDYPNKFLSRILKAKDING